MIFNKTKLDIQFVFTRATQKALFTVADAIVFVDVFIQSSTNKAGHPIIFSFLIVYEKLYR